MDDYQKEIVDRINDNEKWPSIDRPDYIDHLLYLADGAFARDSIEGYLASILIYQQVVEDFSHVLIEDHRFFIQLRLFPSKISFPSIKKHTFGRLIDELNQTFEFSEGKNEFLKLARRLNELRISLVHGLTKLTKLDDVKTKVVEARNLFDQLFEIYDDLHDLFRLAFKDIRKDTDWEDYFEEN